jgi:hypothetical protein
MNLQPTQSPGEDGATMVDQIKLLQASQIQASKTKRTYNLRTNYYLKCSLSISSKHASKQASKIPNKQAR